ncbi:hypothetical protein CVD28_01960 [Bacillus sp. M6-12]|uniref:hypothetical protein n=1 Tax=Bacillus sp. M6-12 TaxID=2054166 RepID=UPI000C7566BA|nr:hypothetical protein [Bacillus sp. M6-12]PLS19197.1 hypothetical protein CVD28_01960 [Bacillus sp. M6-12]
MPMVSKLAWDNPYYSFGEMKRLAPGIKGHLIDTGHKGVYIPTLFSEKQGNGTAGAYIDSLKEAYAQIRFPNVLSPILQGMLKRRGFYLKREYVPILKTHADVYVWRRK